MTLALKIIWSLLPGVFWLVWVLRQDRYEHEPLRQVSRVFVFGMLITIPAVGVEAAGNLLWEYRGPSLLHSALASYLVIGPAEEFFKFFVAYRVMFHHVEFNEPMDGIVYASTAALGFATVENIGYVLSLGADANLTRWLTAVPGHFLMASLYGYAMGLVYDGRAGRSVLAAGVGLAALAHGTYNFSIAAIEHQHDPRYGLLALLVLVTLAVAYRKFVRDLTRISPFRPEAHTRLRVCPECGDRMNSGELGCAGCGALLPRTGSAARAEASR
jgi:RsiW-degrading membrane proteinase PrsW (M82 family)